MSAGAAYAATASGGGRGDGKFHFAVDRGGTFTDVHCRLPDGKTEVVRKLLSEDPAHYDDAPTEGIRRILAEFDDDATAKKKYERGEPVNTDNIGSIRMGTTVATNALLERDGAPMAFLVTAGFADVLEIGNQGELCGVCVCVSLSLSLSLFLCLMCRCEVCG
jgi:5-oxoprolinase (ATP-hydrolysing)